MGLGPYSRFMNAHSKRSEGACRQRLELKIEGFHKVPFYSPSERLPSQVDLGFAPVSGAARNVDILKLHADLVGCANRDCSARLVILRIQ